MMRMLKPANITDPDHISRICAGWIKEGLGLRIIDYRIGNTFTGSIDILSAGKGMVYLVYINTGSLSDTLLCALTGYRWFLENREFLARVYQTGELDLSAPTSLMILSPSFPPEISSILSQGLKVPLKLFQYLIFGSKDNPEIFVEEICMPTPQEKQETQGNALLIKELGLEKAGMSDDEVGSFLQAMRA